MDGCQRAGKRVCLTYVLSFVLLSAFFYYLMAHNSRNNMGIVRLREDVDDISHMLRQQQMESKGAQISNCLGGEPKGMGSGSGRCDNREVTAYVDTLFKRKMGHLMDDVYNLKKQVMSADCSARVGQSAPKSETVSVGKARINYASEELGARIIDVKAPPIGGTNVIKTLLGLDFSANPPVNMLRPALTPGSCFGFSGSRATVILHLAKSIVVEAISLTHVAREMTPTLCVKSAPKEFDVYGLLLDNSKRELLGQWTFDNAANRRSQTYSVHHKGFFRRLAFNFNSNHGANSTCIYRIEVFGRLQKHD
ncbi:SUN domain-containing protein 3 isoform X2 [Drosophila rhopaloa]|uniref:SUN domain-containing protein 3 isoform X2 n=1 Tax=Drosophila rhopaloa TaxID=1041015 RepID=A0A6P4ERJ6_DRORH|nr:SUN domain-containing protein 3 isoform X2 [Drosophila rhopaloa]